MTWLNEPEIDRYLEILRDHAPEIAPYAQYLSDWRDEVNRGSDGWPYWSAATKPASNLSALVKQAVDSLRGRGEMPDEAALRKSLTPIKAAATRLRRQAPELAEPSAAPGFR